MCKNAHASPAVGGGRQRLREWVHFLHFLPRQILRRAVLFYQKRISPLFPPRCKYYPSCSRYALEALELHGAIKGLALFCWRFLRCNPFSRGGVDPVPGSDLDIRRKRETSRENPYSRDAENSFRDSGGRNKKK